jgi:hypothetical protein
MSMSRGSFTGSYFNAERAAKEDDELWYPRDFWESKKKAEVRPQQKEEAPWTDVLTAFFSKREEVEQELLLALFEWHKNRNEAEQCKYGALEKKYNDAEQGRLRLLERVKELEEKNKALQSENEKNLALLARKSEDEQLGSAFRVLSSVAGGVNLLGVGGDVSDKKKT